MCLGQEVGGHLAFPLCLDWRREEEGQGLSHHCGLAVGAYTNAGGSLLERSDLKHDVIFF